MPSAMRQRPEAGGTASGEAKNGEGAQTEGTAPDGSARSQYLLLNAPGIVEFQRVPAKWAKSQLHS